MCPCGETVSRSLDSGHANHQRAPLTPESVNHWATHKLVFRMCKKGESAGCRGHFTLLHARHKSVSCSEHLHLDRKLNPESRTSPHKWTVNPHCTCADTHTLPLSLSHTQIHTEKKKNETKKTSRPFILRSQMKNLISWEIWWKGKKYKKTKAMISSLPLFN